MFIRVFRGQQGLAAEGDLSCRAGHRIAGTRSVADGIFAGWQWTGRDIVVEQDRYGLFPLFEWTTADGRLLSTDLPTLLTQGVPADLDFDALAVFFRVGFFVGADTPFRAIRAVLPPPIQRPVIDISRRAAVEGFIDLFAQGIRRRLPSAPFEMPLSGGRDSRHILFALREAGYAPAGCVTVRHFPPRANDDESVASELCATLDIEHRVIDQPAGRAVVERRKNQLTHLCTDEHGQFVVLADYLRAHTRETYDGIAGDVLSQSTYLRPEVHERFARGDLRGVAEFVLDGYGTMMSERALQRLLAPEVWQQVPRERAIARLVQAIAPHASAPNPTGSFFFANRTRREIALAPYALMRDVTVYAPYLDYDLFDFLAALPAHLLMDRGLHTEAIATAWPEFADIPYERKGLVEQDRHAARVLAAQLMRVVMRGPARPWLQPAAIVPGLAATVVDGDAGRLWGAPLLLWMDQVAEAVVAASANTVRDR